MTSRNQRLMIGALALLIVNALLFVSTTSRSSSLDVDRFAIQDTSAIKQVIITHKDFDNVLRRSAEGWELNGAYKVDSYLRKLLFAVINQVGVRRQLGVPEATRLWAEAPERGYRVRFDGSEQPGYYVIGNGKFTRTFFLVDAKEGYEVEIPGYRDYVGGIFQLTTDQWRHREIFRGTFNSIQSLQIDYVEAGDLKVTYKDRFFEVEGLSQLDSARVVEYLEAYNLLQANEMISSGKFPRYDSLMATEPLATIHIVDIARNKPFTLRVFPQLPNERIYLTATVDQTMAVFQESKINSLLARPSDFEAH